MSPAELKPVESVDPAGKAQINQLISYGNTVCGPFTSGPHVHDIGHTWLGLQLDYLNSYFNGAAFTPLPLDDHALPVLRVWG